MPVKRRTAKRKIAYPDALERLIAGKPIEDSDDNRNALIRLAYFGEFPELEHLKRQASNALGHWRTPSERASRR